MHPDRKEICVTFFGPGFGESIVVHVGDRNWIVIDSCLNDAKEPAALAYLREIGVDLASEVKLVMATHWHDDHIKGLSATLAACESASFAMPVSMAERDFIAFLLAFENQPTITLGSGATEIISCLRQLKGREKKFVSKDKVVSVWDHGVLSHNQRVELLAVSPSEKRVEDFLRDVSNFKKLIPEKPSAGSPVKKRIQTENKNDLSIASILTIGNIALLFGADVEENGNSDYGWSNIVDARTGRLPKPHIYKVAHHGSLGAHLDGIWSKVLRNGPISIITPWFWGGRSLPLERDRERISALSNRTYITSSELLPLKKRYENHRLRDIRKSGVKITGCIYRAGAVSFTIDPISGAIVSEQLAGSAVVI